MKRGIMTLVIVVMMAAALAPAQAPDPGRLLERTTGTRDEVLYLSVDGLRTMMREGRPVRLVDVRAEADWRGTHIEGSVNMRRHEVKVRGALRSGDVVLVDQGWNDRRLEYVCRDLLERGCLAMILDGGINAWMAEGLPVAGTGEGRDAIDSMGAGEYISVRTDGARVAVEPPSSSSTGVILHVRGGQPELDRQLRDMAAMERSETRVIEGPGASVAEPVVPKPCSTCP